MIKEDNQKSGQLDNESLNKLLTPFDRITVNRIIINLKMKKDPSQKATERGFVL
jgi:hypothetical protein